MPSRMRSSPRPSAASRAHSWAWRLPSTARTSSSPAASHAATPMQSTSRRSCGIRIVRRVTATAGIPRRRTSTSTTTSALARSRRARLTSARFPTTRPSALAMPTTCRRPITCPWSTGSRASSRPACTGWRRNIPGWPLDRTERSSCSWGTMEAHGQSRPSAAPCSSGKRRMMSPCIARFGLQWKRNLPGSRKPFPACLQGCQTGSP